MIGTIGRGVMESSEESSWALVGEGFSYSTLRLNATKKSYRPCQSCVGFRLDSSHKVAKSSTSKNNLSNERHRRYDELVKEYLSDTAKVVSSLDQHELRSLIEALRDAYVGDQTIFVSAQ